MSDGLVVDRVTFGYGSVPLLSELSLVLRRGEAVALLGPNGAGKSTLLALASGTLRPRAGGVTWRGEDIHGLPRRRRAQRVTLLPQVVQMPFAFTCRELVALARTAYISPFGRESPRDRDAVERGLVATATAHLADRSVHELSGGERQRVLLAMALAQQPELLLLDEPTAQLDVTHQVAILRLALDLCAHEGVSLVVAIHDLNLAALFFERVAVLHERGIIAEGSPRAVLTPELIRSVYACDAAVVEHPAHRVPLVALKRPRSAQPGQVS